MKSVTDVFLNIWDLERMAVEVCVNSSILKMSLLLLGTACTCVPNGSISSDCNQQGQCLCRPGFGERDCSVCANGSRRTASGCVGMSSSSIIENP